MRGFFYDNTFQFVLLCRLCTRKGVVSRSYTTFEVCEEWFQHYCS